MIRTFPYRDHNRPYSADQREAGRKLAEMIDAHLTAHPELTTPANPFSPTPLDLAGGIVDPKLEAAVAAAGFSQDSGGQWFFKTGTTKGTNAMGDPVTIPLAVVVPIPTALTRESNKRAVVQL